ncbi:efflux transporter outer membrane subunit [Asticcacaulis sp. 201]|uniref:efflux transporter outer membrane subunit n=1 Tax=Asticcacaulis sp. 201 TaxID=3028787 RepID=UPI0029163FDF|nr:efflux transporter outer membrane subunit [Asticcacaulis sp. 201]MDV6330440.1 efflux transporter outer membrane subunit [Asticcacaulis sp. 201]
MNYIRVSTLVAALLTTTALSACTTIPQSAPFASEPSQAKKVNPIQAVSEQNWWSGLGDPQLQRLMNQALNNSPSLAIAEARLNQAQAAVSQYRAADRPNVSVNAAASEALQSNNYLFPPGLIPHKYIDQGQVTLNFNWELDFWGRNRAAIDAASTLARAAEADAAQARLILSTAIASTYVDLDRLYQSRDLAERAVAIRADSAKLVQQKLDNGVSNTAQNEQAKAGIYAAQADLAAIDEQIDINKHMIAMLTGASPDFAATLQRPTLTPSTQAFGAIPSQIDLNLIGRRPDVIAARWRAEAASARIKQAHAAFYPNINLAAFAGFQSLKLDKLFANGSDMGQFGPALSLPLFDGGALKANLKSAESEHALAIASYNQDVLVAMQQVADTLTSQRALQSRLGTSEQALTAYEEAYRLSKLRYDGGLSDYTSLLVAEQSLISQRRVVADLRSRALTLDIALIKSLGGQYTVNN